MIQATLCYQFVLNQSATGEIEPQFKPIQLIFKNEQYNSSNYSDLISENDLFAIFYQHTTGVYGPKVGHYNFYSGRLKETSFNVISYYKREVDGSQYITTSIFELDDELAIFEDLIKEMADRLDISFETIVKALESKQSSIISRINAKIKTDIEFTIFQIERLANLDRFQKAALIFNSDERITILKTLRERPISKRQMKDILERIKPVFNIDLLIEPFLELNLMRRDWIKGERDRHTGRMDFQGEYLFLVKDIILSRIPNNNLIKYLKDSNTTLFENFQRKTTDFFSTYNPIEQSYEEMQKLASLILNPDVYDFLVLMRKNFYPIKKIPKIFSVFANTELILGDLKEFQILTDIEDENGRLFTSLLTDIKPLVIFPEYLLPKIKKAYDAQDKKNKITHEIAEKALQLLEVTYPETIEF